MRLVVERYDPDPAIIGNVVRLDRQRYFVARTRLVPVPPESRPGLADLLVGEPLSVPAGGPALAQPPQPAPGDPDDGTVP